MRYVAEVLQAPTLTIASLRSLYERRPTLYEHQQWAKDYLGLRDLDPTAEAALVAMLALDAAEAAHRGRGNLAGDRAADAGFD